MQKIVNLIIGTTLLAAVSCGTANKDGKPELYSKKIRLDSLKAQQAKLNAEITRLESEIAKMDTTYLSTAKAKLVAVSPLALRSFSHYIDLQGKVDADEIVFVSPRTSMGMPNIVTKIYVKKGDLVKKGQLLLETDALVQEQQEKQLETQLAFAKDVYQRQKNLWDQNIGTEMQVISAKNNVEQVERQIAVLKEQIELTRVPAPVTGILDELNIRVGENFTGFTGSNPQVKIVSTVKGLKVTADIPETYLSSVKKGTPVEIFIPDLNKYLKSTVSLVSQTISATSRGFIVECHIPYDPSLKPNLLAQVRIEDYSTNNALVIPIGTLQSDEKGKYVFVQSIENGKMYARKRKVTVGSVYGEDIEVKDGLKAGDLLITQGYQGLYEGQLITTETK
jgi:membrane fusion protein (multidrug efflux system)